jgi:type I restriction enzyme S subunit
LKGIVSKSKFGSIELPLPPTPLQHQFSKIVKEIEKMKEHQKQATNHVDNLFENLMQKAFRGELMC